jgi:tRNA G18 (ribose-2'-O)-methylase SpoU
MRKLTMAELSRLSRAEFVNAEKKPITLILENIRSGLNVGSIFRIADAFALEQIVLCGITPQPPHREILKTALGSTDSVRWEYSQDAMQVIHDLQKRNIAIWAIEQTDQSQSLGSWHWDQKLPLALIFGNEVHGVSPEVLTELEHSIEIPQFGTKHSLNVAVSVGIVVWHILNWGK